MKGNVYDEQNQVIYCKYKKKSGNVVSEAKISNINLTVVQKRLAGLGIIVNMSPPPFLRIDESTK